MRIRVTAILLLSMAAAAFAQRPDGLSVYTWTREDIFAGPLGNDLNRMNVGLDKLEEILKENPKDPDAMALKAMGVAHLAVLAHESGDSEGFERQYGEALRLLDGALNIDPRGIGVNAVYGGTMLMNQGRIPNQHRQRALEKARDAYNVLYEEQQAQLDNMPLHHKGEVLAGVAESAYRLGNRERADAFMKRIVETIPGTAYARRAQGWLSDPSSVTPRAKLVCQSCQNRVGFRMRPGDNEKTPMRLRFCLLAAFLLASPPPSASQGSDLFDEVEHHFAQNADVRIHYVTLGEGPLVVMIHGFPDFWYTWRDQMAALARDHRVAAIDLRGYNRSDQPAGLENYSMPRLVDDIVAVIEDQGRPQATIVGHDWGGMISWTLAMTRPELVERLIICNLPHPRGLMRELATNPTQQANSQYARNFQKPGAHESLSAEGLAGWVAEPEARTRYVEAFEQSSFEAMLNYYKANYPREPYLEGTSPLVKVQAPVLLIHGLEDQYLLADALSGTWDWLERDLTLVTIPGAGHFVHRDAADFVTDTIVRWLGGSGP